MTMATPRDRFVSVLGLRHDEPRRWSKWLNDTTVDMPMVRWKTTKVHVAEFWKRQNFDLGIDSARENCDPCFLKGKANILAEILENPSAADWWVEMEDHVSKLREGKVER